MDLEGIVAKHKFGPYHTNREESTWFKILNPKYSQKEGREDLFERNRHSEPVPGWHILRRPFTISMERAPSKLRGLRGV